MPRSHSRWPGHHLQGFLLPLVRSPGPLSLECHPNPHSIQALPNSRAWLPTCPATRGTPPALPVLPPTPGRGRRRPEEVWTPYCLKDPSKSRPVSPQPLPPCPARPNWSPQRWKEVGKEVILEANDTCEHSRRGPGPRGRAGSPQQGKWIGPVARG